MTVGPVVPAVDALSCTFSGAADLAGAFCGAPATVHGFADAGAEGDGGVSSVLGCADHGAALRGVCFTVHEIGGDCAMPGSHMNWVPTDEGVVSWCDYPDDPSLAMTEHLRDEAAVLIARTVRRERP